MDSDFMMTDLDCVVVNGLTFTTEERAMLHNSLTLLKEDGKFRKVYFWGKIIGVQKSYFIAFGLHKDILRQRQTFYCQDMKKWNLMTPPSPKHKRLNKFVQKPFLGDPAHEEAVLIPLYSIKADDEVEEESNPSEESIDEFDEEEDDDERRKLPKGRKSVVDSMDSVDDLDLDDIEGEKVITEEERLSCVVHQIDHDTAVAPRGAYVRTPVGEVLNNRFFTGLDLTEATKLHNYMHIRFPKDANARKGRLNNSELTRTIDFLDTIADDDPKGCWSIQIDSTRDVAVLRNLWWPGMVFYHRTSSKDFGFIYIGFGNKNTDLPFML